MPQRQRYVCQDKACRREIEIEMPLDKTPENLEPHCNLCGSEMKKVYSTPTLTKLSKAEASKILEKFHPTEPLQSKGKK